MDNLNVIMTAYACGSDEGETLDTAWGKNEDMRVGRVRQLISAVHHIAIIISKEEHLNFYKLLGFSEVFRKERSYDVAVLMDGYGMELEIFIDQRHERRETEPLGLRHFALKVDGRLEDEIERLRESSSEVLEVGTIMNDWRGVRFVFMKDPDGTVVELHE